MTELVVTTYSHFFKVTAITPRARPAVENFIKGLIQFGYMRSGNGKSIYAALKVFAASTQDRKEYRFHINKLEQFKTQLLSNSLINDMVLWINIPVPVPAEVELIIQPHWKDRDFQTPIIEYLSSREKPIQKFLNLQTGMGKSYSFMKAAAILGWRSLIVVKPMYIEKWQEDLTRTYDIVPEDIVVIQGSASLMALLLLAEDNQLDAKVIIISNKTLQNWIKLYEQRGESILELGYTCTPDKLYEALGVGVRLIDEVHQDFHFNFKLDLYTNVAHAISLSATLVSDDAFINKMYEIAYPNIQRYVSPAYHKYIAAIAVIYRLKYPNKIRTKDPGSNNYTHHAFEKSVMRSPELLNNYLGLINQVLTESYLKKYKPGQKALIYCSSIGLCTIVKDHFKMIYETLDVRRYVEEDPWEDLITPDICVTTLQSAGTGIDLPNLTTVILTTAISSSQSNIQGFGRLRELKENITPQFLYFVCEDVEAHIKYHERKKIILEDRALTYRSIFIAGSL